MKAHIRPSPQQEQIQSVTNTKGQNRAIYHNF